MSDDHVNATSTKRAEHMRKYRHGLSKMKAAVTKYGLRAIDGRSKLAYALKAWQGELIADLGGPGNITTAQKAIIDLASTTRMMVMSLDAWLVEQPSLVRRDQSLIPVIVQRQRLADSLVGMLTTLGLDRKVCEQNLEDLIVARYSGQDHDDDSAAQDGQGHAPAPSDDQEDPQNS